MNKLKLSRAELVSCGLLLLGAAGFGVYRLGQAAYKAQEPRIFEEATRIVALGETILLTHREVGREHNFIPWNGTVEMTIQKVALYASYADAYLSEKDVANPNGLINDTTKDCPFLVVEVRVTNVDAEEGDFTWRYADVTGISGSDGAITLQSAFHLYSDVPFGDGDRYISSALWCVDGESSSDYGASVDIPQGHTVHVVLGFPLEDGAEGQLDGASLMYESVYDRMDIGSPALGGETYASVSQ